MKLKRKKIGDRSYRLIDTATGREIATAAQTGEHGRDNYPWEWHMAGGRIFGRLSASTGRSEESLKRCVESIETEAQKSSILDQAGMVNPFDIKEHQYFRHHGQYYRATQDAYGGYNEIGTCAVIPAYNYKYEQIEVYVPSTAQVMLYAEGGK
jgi:hypothetical protein